MKQFPIIRIAENSEELAVLMAEFFVVEAARGVQQRNRFMTALSGGTTPRRSHGLLATERFNSRIPWHGVHLFWVDERCVDIDDESSNFGSARSDFIQSVEIPENQVHPAPTMIEPEKAAEEYEKEIISTFGVDALEIPRFDCIFLGIGTDGHTASLFPGQEMLWEGGNTVLAVRGGKPNVDRITMNFPLLNQAKHTVLVVSGKEKAKIVREVLACPEAGLPVQRLKPVCGKVTWLLDREASELLPVGFLDKSSG